MDERRAIRSELDRVIPADDAERRDLRDALAWVDSGAGLWRTAKPATPPMHLVSYCVLVDARHRRVVLVDHRKALLWLPTGGHVDPGEHPQRTALREAEEELFIDARFLAQTGSRPLLLTSTVTVGLTAGHTDVSFWYALDGDCEAALRYDPAEFAGARWWSFEEIAAADPAGLDPNLGRFMTKLEYALDT